MYIADIHGLVTICGMMNRVCSGHPQFHWLFMFVGW